jgi:hypothetical protein
MKRQLVFAAYVVYLTTENVSLLTASALLTAPNQVSSRAFAPSRAGQFNPYSSHSSTIIDNSIKRPKYYSSRSSTSLQSTASNSLLPTRFSRFTVELRTFLRVIFPALLSGTVAFLSLPALCFRVANFVTRTTDPGKVGMLSDAVQSFISLVGILYSILVGQVFGFLYSQQEVSCF